MPMLHTLGAVTVDLAAYTVSRRDSSGERSVVRLTPTEWRILEVLLRNPDLLVPKRYLLVRVWGPAYAREHGYLRLFLCQLRKKLEPDPSMPRYLVTEPGMGYRFISDP